MCVMLVSKNSAKDCAGRVISLYKKLVRHNKIYLIGRNNYGHVDTDKMLKIKTEVRSVRLR